MEEGNEMRAHKFIRHTIGTMALLAGLCFPFTARAQEDLDIPYNDGVVLRQQADTIEVFAKINNAGNEKIRALSLNLQVDEPETTAQFFFDPALERQVVAESRYDAGSLGIYVASDAELFSGEELLRLGELKVMPQDGDKTLDITVSFGALQAVNAAHGNVSLDVRREPEPVKMSVGRDAVYGTGDGSGYTAPPVPEQQTGADTPSGQSGSSADGRDGDNIQEGLNDDTTRYVNDPGEAKDIPSNVLRTQAAQGLIDLSSTGAAGSVLNLQAAGTAAGIPGGVSDVTVIKPEKGPSGLLVSAAGGQGAESGSAAASFRTAGGAAKGGTVGMAGGGNSVTPGSFDAQYAAENGGGSAGAAEAVSFDTKNGGVRESGVFARQNAKRSVGRLLILAGTVCGVVLAVAAAICAILRERRRRLRRRRALARARAKSGRRKKKRAA